MNDDAPLDPFLDDPVDPATAMDGGPHGGPDDEPAEPLSPAEREDVLADLADLEVFQTLLEPTGIRGIVVDCDDCGETHYFSWDLMRANLRHLLDAGQTRVHEPPFDPKPRDYVSWDCARGYADAVVAVAEQDA